MKTEFTKGDWVAKGLHIKVDGISLPIAQAMIVEFKLDTKGRSLPDTQGIANAKLIAAAPDLLDALQQILSIIEYEGMPDNEASACHNAHKAINKALQNL